MSCTYSIVCHDSKQKLWIGQRNYIYTADEKLMGKLSQFLFENIDKKLEFICDDSASDEIDEYVEYKEEIK